MSPVVFWPALSSLPLWVGVQCLSGDFCWVLPESMTRQFYFLLLITLAMSSWFVLLHSPGVGVYTGRLRHEVQTLSLLYTIFDRKGNPSIYLQ